MPLPNILEFIGTNITQRKFQQSMEKLLGFTDELDKRQAATANGYYKSYATLAAANADIANIPFGTSVKVLSAADGGEYYKITSSATSLTKSPHDPLMQSKTYTDSSIDELVAGYETGYDFNFGFPRFNLSAFSGVTDPNLLVGVVSSNGTLNTSIASGRCAKVEIPAGANTITKMVFKTEYYYALVDSTNKLLKSGLTSSSDISIPTGSVFLIFTVVNEYQSNALDFAADYIDFAKKDKVLTDNSVVKVDDLPINVNHKDTVLSVVNMADIPDLSTATNPTTLDYKYDIKIWNGYVSTSGHVSLGHGNYTLMVAIPTGAKRARLNLSVYTYFAFTSYRLAQITPGTVVNPDESFDIPSGARFIIVTIKSVPAQIIDRLNDSIIFYSNVAARKDAEIEFKRIAKTDAGKIMLAKKLYTFIGDDFRLYTESLFSGLAPKSNYSVEVKGSAVSADKGKFIIIGGSGVVNVEVFDQRRVLIDSKSATVYKKEKPTSINKQFDSSNKLKVLFIGDSLIHFNANKIGQEWLRMLNTNVSTEQIIDGCVYPATYNFGNGNIELVGRYGGPTNKYEIGNKLSILMSGISSSLDTSGNPFFDSSSSNPNELDLDGWNKKVDIAKYFQSVCGTGKHPDYIYMACGVNDIVDFKWDMKALVAVSSMLSEVLTKIKEACDQISGGNSSVKILLMNHQFYPLNEGAYSSFRPAWQRQVWAQHYENYENLIESGVDKKGVPFSEYVRFVDCASSFDIENGYARSNMRSNPRLSKTEGYIIDTVHMGTGGALQYADALLRDFLYHECV